MASGCRSRWPSQRDLAHRLQVTGKQINKLADHHTKLWDKTVRKACLREVRSTLVDARLACFEGIANSAAEVAENHDKQTKGVEATHCALQYYQCLVAVKHDSHGSRFLSIDQRLGGLARHLHGMRMRSARRRARTQHRPSTWRRCRTLCKPTQGLSARGNTAATAWGTHLVG